LAFDAALSWGFNANTKFGGTASLKIWDGKKRHRKTIFRPLGSAEPPNFYTR